MAKGKPKGDGHVELLCDDCGVEIFVDDNMVMLNDELWYKINGNKFEGALCDECIEKKLKRPITSEDFKISHTSPYGTPLCNILWFESKRK